MRMPVQNCNSCFEVQLYFSHCALHLEYIYVHLIDPADWTPGNVQKWILWTEHQYRLPQIGKSFQDLSGKDVCAMSEEQFRQRSPACGDVLHAHLDIWKSGAFADNSWERTTSKMLAFE